MCYCSHQHTGPCPPPASCAESVRLRAELATAWAEAYRLRWAVSEVRITEGTSRAAEQAKVMKRKLDCLEAACGAALVIAVAAAVACVKWMVS